MGCLHDISLHVHIATQMVLAMSRLSEAVRDAYTKVGTPILEPNLSGMAYANDESRRLAELVITTCGHVKAAKAAGVDLGVVPELSIFTNWHQKFDSHHAGTGPEPDVDGWVSAMLGETVVGAEIKEELVAA